MTDTRTPIDTLRDAHQLVVAQLAAATPGPWFVGYNEPTGASVFSNYQEPPADHIKERDAELIVTSVNLLPTVRDILAEAIKYIDDRNAYPGGFHTAAFRLARAMLNEGE